MKADFSGQLKPLGEFIQHDGWRQYKLIRIGDESVSDLSISSAMQSAVDGAVWGDATLSVVQKSILSCIAEFFIWVTLLATITWCVSKFSAILAPILFAFVGMWLLIKWLGTIRLLPVLQSIAVREKAK